MLAFNDEFNNDDPLVDIKTIIALNTLHAAVLLVLGNLAGVWTTSIAARVGFYFLAAVILGSVIVSYFYHLCQTTHACFLFKLADWVAIDHFTSTSMLGVLLLHIVNARTTCQMIYSRTVLKIAPTVQVPLDIECRPKNTCAIQTFISTPPSLYTEINHCECGVPLYKHCKFKRIAENGIYDWWTASSTFAIIVITAIAVYAHPFSYAAFNIVIAAVVILWFFKIVLVDEGEPLNFIGRISWPELIIAIILGIIGLAAYVIDAFIEYEILHSLWHVAIYIAVGFFIIGTNKSVNGWSPLWRGCCCC